MMKNRNSEAMFGIRKGIALYFNDFIEKDKIKEIIRQILEIIGAKFTSKRAQGEPKIRLIRGGWEKVFDNTFKNSTFDDGANILMLTDATKETLQTTQISSSIKSYNHISQKTNVFERKRMDCLAKKISRLITI